MYPGYSGLQYMYAAQQQASDYPADRNALGDGKAESKPRLSKDEVERLEKIFQENPKPSSSVKAQLAEELGLERPRINNWFQNRRAKAKQERKQEEYEARRAAENGDSESRSPLTETSSGVAELFDEEDDERAKSSATFPSLDAATNSTPSVDNEDDGEDDAASHSEHFGSPYAPQPTTSHIESTAGELQSPLSVSLPQTESVGFSYPHATQAFGASESMQTYAPFGLQDGQQAKTLGLNHVEHVEHGLPSPEENLVDTQYQSNQYLEMLGPSYPASALPYYQPHPIMEDELKQDHVKEEQDDFNGTYHTEQVDMSLSQDGSTLGNSFKAPPPPANIASRRNIARPAALTVATPRSRSYNLGPKTGMDSYRRADPTSPATAMRRIASAGGNMAGRIQKQATGPRSPLFLNRNTEAYLQFRSPVFSAAFTGATPPTPMTPAIMSQGRREPAVSSTCSDDDSFMLGHGMDSLKTPPETPGVMGVLGNTFNHHAFNNGMDFAAEQPLLTPGLPSEMPDLTMRHMPSYVEMGDASLPTTPLYSNMMSSMAQDPNSLVTAVSGNAQFDWDANESINSSRSSPGQPRSRQIQFTPNMTPQDYNAIP